ncbi:MAG: polysulfide reductase NrfD [Ardenticatenaceae bacterium]|nr:polysulfide reductase NrfD [Ardenticatenaceae bacterium]
MNYGFLIDQRKCIGCHACSTACKSENEVPLGVYRTWVKSVDKGTFPNTRRFFQVTRCNHCANPPCVRICPVEAMYQRDDGIVEFDPRICIGCKACLHACPYDAIYIDPESKTAAKCHFCAHRVEVGLEPACVVVCPEQAIVAGDLDDPRSEINRLIGSHHVSVRKPEQGTAPKLFYIDANAVTLTPTASHTLGSFAFADVVSDQAQAIDTAGTLRQNGHQAIHHHTTTGFAVREAREQSLGGWAGPITIGGTQAAEHMIQTVYNAQHKIPWHWPVPAYLVTKNIGSGIFMLVALLFGLGVAPFSGPVALLSTFASLLFIGLTALLLVIDLERPERFHTILTRPQWKSWLTRGAFLLVGFAVVAGLWFLVEGAAALNGALSPTAAAVRPFFLAAGFVLALASAIYTAFLFGQAEGRDLWQSTLLPVHLVVQALMVGASALLLLALFVTMPSPWLTVLVWTFGLMLIIDLFVTLVGEFGMPHTSETAARAAHEIHRGKFRLQFWGGSITLGHLLPLVLLLVATVSGSPAPVALAIAALAAAVGLYLFEFAFVMAPQEIPNS